MGGEDNEIIFNTADGSEHWPRMAKRAVAEKLVTLIAGKFS